MIEVSRNLRTSLPTEVSIDKYFYLTNSNYHPHSNYIYICFEDNNFGLSDIGVKYCLTNTDPISYPNKAVSGCFFSTIYYYYKQSSSGTTKYCYKIPTTSYYYYSIVYYQGSYSSGYLYVTSDYNDLAPTVRMTQVSRNSRTSLPTTSSEDKYFYLTNSNYYSYSSYIYICLEDNNFGLSYNNIKYCRSDTNLVLLLIVLLVAVLSVQYLIIVLKVLLVQLNIITRFPPLILTLIPLFIMKEAILLEIFILLVIIIIY